MPIDWEGIFVDALSLLVGNPERPDERCGTAYLELVLRHFFVCRQCPEKQDQGQQQHDAVLGVSS